MELPPWSRKTSCRSDASVSKQVAGAQKNAPSFPLGSAHTRSLDVRPARLPTVPPKQRLVPRKVAAKTLRDAGLEPVRPGPKVCQTKPMLDAAESVSSVWRVPAPPMRTRRAGRTCVAAPEEPPAELHRRLLFSRDVIIIIATGGKQQQTRKRQTTKVFPLRGREARADARVKARLAERMMMEGQGGRKEVKSKNEKNRKIVTALSYMSVLYCAPPTGRERRSPSRSCVPPRR